jgi:hypothetical protein
MSLLLFSKGVYKMGKKLDLRGEVYHYLTVIEEAEPIKGRRAWKCRCRCDTIKVVKQENLRDGSTKSCGCWNDEQRSNRASNMYSVNIKYSTPREATAVRIWQKRYNDGDISFEQFLELSQIDCFYCDSAPNNKQNVAKSDPKSSQYARDNGDFIYNGLDRINSDLPHNLDNVVPCDSMCNWAKSDHTQEEFGQWICKVYHNWAKKFDK